MTVIAVVLGWYLLHNGVKSKPVALNASQKSVIADLLRLAEKVKSEPSPLLKDLPPLEAVTDKEGAGFFLAKLYIINGDYAKGMEEYDRLSAQGGKDSKVQVHFSLGNVYYDLALLDMMNRQLFTQTRIGFFLLKPDAQTKLVLTAANEEFKEGIAQTGEIPEDSKVRMKQLEYYLKDTPSSTAVTIDQAKCSLWLLNLAQERPELVEASRRVLNSFRWVMFLQKEPPLLASTPFFIDVRKKRMGKITTVCGDYGPEIKAIYNLACLTSYWASMYAFYSVVEKKGDGDPKYQEILKSLGKDILEAADLLDLPLPAEARAVLAMEAAPDGMMILMQSLESGLQSNYSPRCRLLYAVIHAECNLTSYSYTEDMINRLGKRAIPALTPMFARIARNAGGDEGTQAEIMALGREEITPATASKVAMITDRLFSKVLADIRQSDQWHQ